MTRDELDAAGGIGMKKCFQQTIHFDSRNFVRLDVLKFANPVRPIDENESTLVKAMPHGLRCFGFVCLGIFPWRMEGEFQM